MLRRHKRIVHAFVIGRLDYCNSHLYGLPTVHLGKLQRVQNSDARIICNISRYDHVTPVLYALRWLPIRFRISFKICTCECGGTASLDGKQMRSDVHQAQMLRKCI